MEDECLISVLITVCVKNCYKFQLFSMVTIGHDDVCIVTDMFLSADLDATAPKEDAVGA